jgi:hypothetical protein
MNPFFPSEEAARIPAQPEPSLRSGQFRSAIPNTYSTIPIPASLRSIAVHLRFAHQKEMKDVLKRAGISWHGWHGFRTGFGVESESPWRG